MLNWEKEHLQYVNNSNPEWRKQNSGFPIKVINYLSASLPFVYCSKSLQKVFDPAFSIYAAPNTDDFLEKMVAARKKFFSTQKNVESNQFEIKGQISQYENFYERRLAQVF